MKYALITGACGGLGRALTENLVNGGHRSLILVGTNAQRLETYKNELLMWKPELGIETLVCDQSQKQSRTNFKEFINNKEIDIACLNAGYIDEGLQCKKTEDEIEKVIQTNCEGTILLAKHLIDNAKAKSATLSLLVTSSLSAFYPMPRMAIYAATKSMILNYFLALAEEEKKNGINITVVCPGGIYTTSAMKDAIASQGLAGKLSSHSPTKVAKIALSGLKRKKRFVVPGFFNKFLKFFGTILPRKFVAKNINKIWEKSQNKRNL